MKEPINYPPAVVKWKEETYWTSLQFDAKAFMLILGAITNLGGIGVGIYYANQYIPSWYMQPLPYVPWMVGLLFAIQAWSKRDTFPGGVGYFSAPAALTPVVGLSLCASAIALGPFVYFRQYLDMIPYEDPDVRNRIAEDLQEEDFEYIAKTYGNNPEKLFKFCFVKEEGDETKAIFLEKIEEMRVAIENRDYYKNDKHGAKAGSSVDDDVKNLNDWWTLKKDIMVVKELLFKADADKAIREGTNRKNLAQRLFGVYPPSIVQPPLPASFAN